MTLRLSLKKIHHSRKINSRIQVHYEGWGNKWDERISRTSPRLCFVPGTHIPPDVQTGFVQPELLLNKSSNIRSGSVSEEERLKHKKAKRYPSLSDSVFENLDLSSSHISEKSDSEERSIATTTPTRFVKHCNAISHGKPFRIRTWWCSSVMFERDVRA